jgi:uncharacterized protein
MKNNLEKVFSFLLIGGLIFFYFSYNPEKKSEVLQSENISSVCINTKCISVDTAFTETEREQGLSGTDPIPKDHGLLFIFQEPDRYGFWMKDMNYPIDIIWISGEGRIVSTKEGATPESFPETFFSEEPSLYVLETLAGFVKENGIKIGDIVSFN